jgi:transposase
LKPDSTNVKDTIDLAQQLLEQEKKISKTFKAVLMMLFTLMRLILDNLSGNREQADNDLKAENARLQEELLLLRQKIFGKSSEAQVGEPMVTVDAMAASEPVKTIDVAAHTRAKNPKKKGRKIDTSSLPRYKKYYDLPAGQLTCGCCDNYLEKIDEDICEQLEILPALLYVIEHIRAKYACRKCQTIIMAPKLPAPLPKALAGGSLLADVAVNKFQYHLPLYRQSKIFASYNVDIPDNTLGNWVMQSGLQLMGYLAEPMWQATTSVKYLQVDESPVKVQTADKKGYLWTYYAPYVGIDASASLVMFEFNLTRSGSVPEQRLANFKGVLQTDGYAGYNNLRKRKDIAGIGCNTHARRKFSDVLKISKNPDGVAAEFIERVKPLYALEAKMRDLNFSFHTKKRLRQKQAWPIFKALRPWLKQQLVKVPPRSKLGQAINYTLNQWPYIIAYLRHGIAEIDTNWVENEIRPSAVGKRNWLFMNNEDSGNVNAFWFSLVQSALINKLNPRVYIHFLLTKIHSLRKNEIDPITLLPHVIDKDILKTFEAEQLAVAKLVLNGS